MKNYSYVVKNDMKSFWLRMIAVSRLLLAKEYLLVTSDPNDFKKVKIDKRYINEIDTAIGKLCSYMSFD